MDGGAPGRMTLVFALPALERLAEPAEVVADARRWSDHVGVAGDAPSTELTAAVDRLGLDPDFVSRVGTAGSLAAIRQRFATERHVFVGTSDDDRGISEALGWEYLPVGDAAAKAGWTLADDSGTGEH